MGVGLPIINQQREQMRQTQEVTGNEARELRIKAKLRQKEFWESLGSNQSSGCAYESGATAIPGPLQKLIRATYMQKQSAAELTRMRKAVARAAKILNDAQSYGGNDD